MGRNIDNKGFTLVELVVTVAILLALATIAVVSVTATLKKSKSDISTIQDYAVQQAIRSWALENCSKAFCTINNGDLDEYFDNSSSADLKYPITVTNTSKGVSAFTDGTLAEKIIENHEKNIVTDKPTFNSVQTGSEANLYIDNDNDGLTYYFRGAVTNNYVKFAGKTWRIVRINGDGTIRLILEGDTNSTVRISGNTGEEKYVGYTYTQNNSTTDSSIKTHLNTWYENNLNSYDKYIENSIFCNETTSTQVSASAIHYIGYTRNKDNNSLSPSFKCNETDKSYGGIYRTKIGLITADEVVFAGGLYEYGTTNHYLKRTYTYWTMTPGFYNGSNAYGIYIKSNGDLYYALVRNYYSIVPVINLKADVIYSSGDGTSSNPYTIET